MGTSPSGYITARVVEVTRLSPSFIRVVFDNPEPEQFVSSGVPDEIVHLYFPAEGESAPPPMEYNGDTLGHHRPEDVRECRNYTVRRWDRDTISIDFVDHGGGVASSWARSATPGQHLGMWGTRSWYRPPGDTDWMLLAADLPGIPAMLRVIEQLPPGQRAHAIAEVAHADDVLTVNSVADATVEWCIGGNDRAESQLAQRVTSHPVPDGPGYVWFAGEASVGRAVRKHFRKDSPLTPNRLAIVGYWRADKQEWLDRYRDKSEQLMTEFERIDNSSIGDAEAELYWDEILEREGL